MNLADQYQRRMASLIRAEAGRNGKVSESFASIALARRLASRLSDERTVVDPISASAPAASPFLLRA